MAAKLQVVKMSNCLNYNTCYNARQFRHAASGRLRLGGKLLSSRKLSPADTIDQAARNGTA
jgi:hypothetical protein